MDDKLKDFCKNYEVKIVNDNGRYARYHPPTFFTDPCRADIIRNDIMEYQSERLFTVQIPESRLNTLIDMEKRFFNWRSGESSRDMLAVLMDKEREETFYRNSNKAIEKAYKQYSMLLNLAGYQRKI